MKHSYGPWHEDGYAIMTPDGSVICDIGTADVRGESEEGIANGRLIAAAPELLEACKEVQRACAGGDWQKAIEMTKAAIAKAT